MVETRRNRERLTLLLIIARSAAEFAEATEGDAGTKPGESLNAYKHYNWLNVEHSR